MTLPRVRWWQNGLQMYAVQNSRYRHEKSLSRMDVSLEIASFNFARKRLRILKLRVIRSLSLRRSLKYNSLRLPHSGDPSVLPEERAVHTDRGAPESRRGRTVNPSVARLLAHSCGTRVGA